MRYKAVRELDGTYSIRASVMGMNYSEVCMLGVRPCNVNRVVNRLYTEDTRKELRAKREAQLKAKQLWRNS
jgi:hypothetical protein